VPTFRSLAIKH